jgi:hypothetical protein
MVLRSENNKLTFLVNTMISIGLENKGASFALHKLAHEIALKGHYVYVFNEPKYPHENIKVIPTQIVESFDGGWRNQFVWEGFSFNLKNTISISPNITYGNPFNTTHNVRWVLHDYSQEQWNTFDVNDVIVNYGTFKVPEGTNQTQLTVFDYNFDKFYNKNNSDRKGFGHIIHKNTPDWGLGFLKNLSSTEIPHYNGKKDINYLLDEFNKYEYVLTFDDKSYYTTAAALCGAKSIILNPNKDILPIEYRLQNPIQMCGVAYGMNDIKWAEQTIGLVKDNLRQLEDRDNKTIDEFIKYWEIKILNNG